MFFQWGALLAQFHNGTEDLLCPDLVKKPILYNLDHVFDIRKYTQGLPEEHCNLVFNILDNYESNIKKCLTELPKGFLHGDFNGYNVLAREESSKSATKTYVIDGILDFEDMHYGNYVWDIGLMIAHMFEECTKIDAVEAGGHAMAGYLSRRRLSDEELSFVKMCIECRLSQALILCAYSGRLDPTNSYVAEWSDGNARYKILQKISGIPNAELQEKWQNIFKLYSKKK
ncbi:hydroxylysine kinase [Trichonephila clavata]|uniref:Hydroxylysine kinase n=1 Tax=Trichonephila clavata TaxID=2740835 RepID=A0A8X6GDF1_TRICU|nr:hydroxylysine kinase [Trichonephila clavata]